mmetsp:Transcript_34873/g.6278  ORF Transcript_34873/g.6278 Transcript_34873/m.6278 type:complete len:95 (+) Transcript_34873:2877-3161(+)
MEDINNKEELLGWTPTEFTKLDEARVNIKPYDDLWRLVLVSKEREEQCKLSYVKELDPEEIEREFRQLLGTSRKLLYNFKDKAAGPADVAKFTQ